MAARLGSRTVKSVFTQYHAYEENIGEQGVIQSVFYLAVLHLRACTCGKRVYRTISVRTEHFTCAFTGCGAGFSPADGVLEVKTCRQLGNQQLEHLEVEDVTIFMLKNEPKKASPLYGLKY